MLGPELEKRVNDWYLFILCHSWLLRHQYLTLHPHQVVSFSDWQLTLSHSKYRRIILVARLHNFYNSIVSFFEMKGLDLHTVFRLRLALWFFRIICNIWFSLLGATNHWADISLELCITTLRSCPSVIPLSSETIIFVMNLELFFPIYIYPTLSVKLLLPFHYLVTHFCTVLNLFKVLHFTA